MKLCELYLYVNVTILIHTHLDKPSPPSSTVAVVASVLQSKPYSHSDSEAATQDDPPHPQMNEWSPGRSWPTGRLMRRARTFARPQR